jgi:hypothetical protein
MSWVNDMIISSTTRSVPTVRLTGVIVVSAGQCPMKYSR